MVWDVVSPATVGEPVKKPRGLLPRLKSMSGKVSFTSRIGVVEAVVVAVVDPVEEAVVDCVVDCVVDGVVEPVEEAVVDGVVLPVVLGVVVSIHTRLDVRFPAKATLCVLVHLVKFWQTLSSVSVSAV